MTNDTLQSHHSTTEAENVDFLMSPEGGGLPLDAIARRLGVGVEGLKKRTAERRKKVSA